MPIFIDPVTRQRVIYAEHSGDIQYDLEGDDAIAEETVPVIGTWEDWTGSATIDSHDQLMNAGRSNQLFGEDASYEGARLPDLGVRGQNKQTTRNRRIRRRAEFKGNKVIVYDERIKVP